MKDSINFLLAGVGGQGTILASDVLVNVGMMGGYQAKQAEVHGMSQRGGSVTSHVRWGQVVYSPLVGAGEVDVYLAFELAEALRNLNQLRPGALAVINRQAIKPVTVTSGGQTYPGEDLVRAALAQVTPHAVYVDGEGIASALGNVRAANVVLLGALSAVLEQAQFVGPPLVRDAWLEVLTQRVPPRYVALNQRAFDAGRALLQESV
jgi:indolepyruvate ferredoxin oxidoreductase beta subunit